MFNITFYNIKKGNFMDVYWSAIDSPFVPFIKYQEPELVLRDISKQIPAGLQPQLKITNCPAFKDSCRNTYALYTPVDYELTYEGIDITTGMYDEPFFKTVVNIRDTGFQRMTSLNFKYMFFSQQDLTAEVLPCFLTSNGFTDNADLIPGKMDIGQWIRPVECAYFAKPGDRTVRFTEGEPFAFVRFDTSEKIRLRKFAWTPKLDHIVHSNLQTRIYKPKFLNLQYYYDLFTRSGMRGVVLKEIQDNLI
jgi:hypothetical protein